MVWVVGGRLFSLKTLLFIQKNHMQFMFKNTKLLGQGLRVGSSLFLTSTVSQNKKGVCLPSPARPAKIGPPHKCLSTFPLAFFFLFRFFVSLEILRKPIHTFNITTTLWLAPAFIDTWDLLRCTDRSPYQISFPQWQRCAKGDFPQIMS